jgi:hypothetical protein
VALSPSTALGGFLGRKQVLVLVRDLTSGFHQLRRKRFLLGLLQINDNRDDALVFHKQTVYDYKLGSLLRFVFLAWYISAPGRA